MGSPIYKGNRAACDAACVALVRAAGAVILGKTVTAEFAGMFPGPTTNPHNPAHTPGGSSSGSAAAVADFMVPAAFGTQTGGSVLRPAAYCGVVGYKPTFNLINRAGIKFAAESLDTIGLIARTDRRRRARHRALVIGKAPAPAHARHRAAHRALPHAALGHRAAGNQAGGRGCRASGLPPPAPRCARSCCRRNSRGSIDASRETINNYERSKRMAADWAAHGERISKVLGDRIKLGHGDAARRTMSRRCGSPNTAAR